MERKEALLLAAKRLHVSGLCEASRWAIEHSISVCGDELEDQSLVGCLAAPHYSTEEESAMLLARCHFDLREYLRCSHTLKQIDSLPALFMRLYALYLGAEKRREEESFEQQTQEQGILGSEMGANRELTRIEEEIRAAPGAMEDGLCLYLLGVVLRDQDRKEESLEVLCQSVARFPWNRSAWADMVALCLGSERGADALSLPNHWMRRFFEAELMMGSQRDQALDSYTLLAEEFPSSPFILSQMAAANQDLGHLSAARRQFEALIEREPHRLDGMDVFSNMLYVQGDRARLSHLAHHTHSIDKFRPETCCTVGNYYSLRQQHEKAVVHFSRALRLDRRWLSAWTLMGHEYLEMKNSAAAIQAYRRAIDINPRDYRAWYGLGQTYEILQMYYYSLFYYQKVTSLRPYDSRFWVALGTCYTHLDRDREAIDCLERAESNGDDEGVALTKLAELYTRVEDLESAAKCHERNAARNQNRPERAGRVAESLLFLGEYHKRRGQLDMAQGYCMHLLGLDAPLSAKDKARALLRDIQSSQQHAAA